MYYIIKCISILMLLWILPFYSYPQKNIAFLKTKKEIIEEKIKNPEKDIIERNIENLEKNKVERKSSTSDKDAKILSIEEDVLFNGTYYGEFNDQRVVLIFSPKIIHKDNEEQLVIEVKLEFGFLESYSGEVSYVKNSSSLENIYLRGRGWISIYIKQVIITSNREWIKLKDGNNKIYFFANTKSKIYDQGITDGNPFIGTWRGWTWQGDSIHFEIRENKFSFLFSIHFINEEGVYASYGTFLKEFPHNSRYPNKVFDITLWDPSLVNKVNIKSLTIFNNNWIMVGELIKGHNKIEIILENYIKIATKNSKRPPKNFPWPPREASSYMMIDIPDPDSLFNTLGNVFDFLEAKLKNCGYNTARKPISIYGIPEGEGFALVTAFEKINCIGQSAPGDERWMVDTYFDGPFKLVEFINQLLFTPPSIFRIFVFAITKDTSNESTSRASAQEVAIWQGRGGATLPSNIARRPYTDEYHARIIIYQFRKERGKAYPELMVNTRDSCLRSPHHHLINAGLEQLVPPELLKLYSNE
jgi:hypothetical protein